MFDSSPPPPIIFNKWEYQDNVKSKVDERPKVQIDLGLGTDPDTKKQDGLVIKWSASLYAEGKLFLLVVAEDSFQMLDISKITFEVIRQIISKSYFRVQSAYESRTKEDGYKTVFIYRDDPTAKVESFLRRLKKDLQ